MANVVNIEVVSTSPEKTIEIARSIGSRLKGGEVLELIGDLGSGKTTFTKGLAGGIGYEDMVQSPSFTIGHEYKTDNLTLMHYDFYRLTDPGHMLEELDEALSDKQTVVVIEWADLAHNILPDARLVISFRADKLDETKRLLKIKAPSDLKYLIANIN